LDSLSVNYVRAYGWVFVEVDHRQGSQLLELQQGGEAAVLVIVELVVH
jgi:hypothetical protein